MFTHDAKISEIFQREARVLRDGACRWRNAGWRIASSAASMTGRTPRHHELAFGGDDWRTLYFMTRSSLFSVNVKIPGVAVPVKMRTA
jgi:hypothetical protein